MHAARFFCLAVLAPAAILLAATAVRADSFTSAELGYDKALLNQFNLVTLGNYTTTNETEGRILVGGNATVTGSTNVCFSGSCAGNTTTAIDATGASYGALTVFGNLTGGFSVGNNGGDINVGGTSSGAYNLRGKGKFNVAGLATGTAVDSATAIRTMQGAFLGTYQNSPTPLLNQTLSTVFPFSNSFNAGSKKLSKGLAALPGSPGVSAQALTLAGNNVFFTVNNDYVLNGKKYGVVTTTLQNLASQQNFQGINNGTNDATFVIVKGDGANYVLPTLNSYTGANKVIYDFVDATTLRFNGTWSGTILAPLATITQQGGFIDGSVVVASLAQSQELHMGNIFTGDLSGLAGFTFTNTPEPASMAIFAFGAVGAGLAKRRKHRLERRIDFLLTIARQAVTVSKSPLRQLSLAESVRSV